MTQNAEKSGAATASFRLLGEFEVFIADRMIPITSTRQRIVLAMLLMAPNHVVPLDRLIDAVWDGEPPSTARGQIQICISALRHILEDPEVITTSPGGYSIKAGPEQLDYARFDRTLAKARAAESEGRLADAVTQLDAALDLWRGAALTGVPGRAAEALANRLEERRVMALESRVSIRLSLGEHSRLIDELLKMTEDYPMRERPYGFLMLALYRSGRQAEALTTYHRARHSLIEELGIEPSEELRQLETAILSHDSSLDLAEQARHESRSGPVRPPRQLPADMPGFVGREKQIEELVSVLASADSDAGGAPNIPIAVVTGQPGCGKSTLTLHVAHQLRERFPDGQLYADMHGHSAQPTSAMEVLGRFMRALGEPAESLPADPDERVSSFRSLLAMRRILLVFDGVADEEQIASLLPGGPGSGVLISSRSRLSGLPGVHVLELDILAEADGIRLLESTAGRARVAGDRKRAAELVALCGGLPLALRIAGVRLAAHPHWSISTLVDRLSEEEHRLDELRHGSVGVRNLLAVVYESLKPRTRRLFRLLATLDLHDAIPMVAAAVLEGDLRTASRELDDLAVARLLNVQPGGEGQPARYSFHDLVRVFASECADQAREDGDPAAEQRAAMERVLSALLTVAGEAYRRIYGGDYTVVRGSAPRSQDAEKQFSALLHDPMAWLESQRRILLTAVGRAARLGMDEFCWELAVNSVAVYEAYGLFDEWRESHLLALEATRRAGNRRGQAAILVSLGSLGLAQHSKDDVGMLLEALTLFEQVEDEAGQALALRNLAHLDRIQGRPAQAVERYERALKAFRAVGDAVAQAHVLSGLGRAHLDLGRADRAEALTQESLEVAQRLGNRRLESQALYRLGEIYLLSPTGKLSAKGVFQQTLELTRQLGDKVGEVYSLAGLGQASLECGELDSAEIHLDEAVELCRTVADRNVQARAIFNLGRVYDERHEHERAELYYVRAANAFARQEDGPSHALAIDALERVRRAAGHLPSIFDA